MTDRLDRVLRWTVVLSWLVVCGWIFFLLGIYDVGIVPEYDRPLSVLLPDSFSIPVSALTLLGASAASYVLLRTVFERRTSIPAGAAGGLLLIGLGIRGLPLLNPEIIYAGVVPFPIALVLISWGIHRSLQPKQNRGLPTFGTFVLAVLMVGFAPLYWLLFYVPFDPTVRSGILGLTALGCTVVIGVVVLQFTGALWRRLAGRSFLDWWRNPANPGTKSPGSLDGLLHVLVVLYWFALSLLMLFWRAAFVQHDVVARESYLLTTYPLPHGRFGTLALLALIGTAASIYVLARSVGSEKPVVTAAVGPLLLVGVGVVSLPRVGPDVVNLSIVPFPFVLVGVSLIAHRYLRGKRTLAQPSLGVFFLAVLAVAYLPLFSYLMVNPIDPRPRVRIGQLTMLGHVFALCISVFSVPGSFHHLHRGQNEATPPAGGASSDRTEWPLPFGGPSGNPVRGQSFAVAPDPDRGWTVGGSATTCPVVKNNVVVTGTADGALVAVNALTGDRSWTVTVDTADALVATTEFLSAYAGGGECLVALDLETGDVEWRERFDAPVAGPPIPRDDTLFAACTDGTVSARNAKDGHVRWVVEMDGVTRNGVAVADGLVYTTSPDGTVTALDADHGEVAWSTETGGEELGAPVVAGGTLYATSGDGSVWMLDASDGSKPRPTTTTVDHPERPAVTEDVLVVAGRGGTVAAFDHDGVERWSAETDPVSAAPVLIDETVYVPTETTLVGLSAATGDRQWSLPVAAPVRGIAPVDDAVYLGTEEGLVGIPDADVAESWGSRDDSETADKDASGGDRDGSGGQAESKPDGEEAVRSSEQSAGSHGTRGQEDRTSEPPSPLVDANAAIEAVDPVDTDGPLQEYRADLGDGHTGAYLTALSPDYVDDGAAVSSFLESANRWSGISKNTNVTTVFGVGESPRPWIAFEGAGSRLDRELQNLDREERLDVLLDLAEAIRTGGMYNVVHGALVPDVAYLLDDGGTGPVATVADWGLDRSVRTALDGQVEPTPYTAPEQLDGGGENVKTDVYRLGAVAYLLLTEREPFEGRTDIRSAILEGSPAAPTELAETLPPAVDDVVLRAMALDQPDRYSSPYDFRQRLDAAFR